MKTGLKRAIGRAYSRVLTEFPRHPRLVGVLGWVPHQYDADFYVRNRAASLRSAQTILSLLMPRLRPQTVVDVGAGTGPWLEAAQARGATRAVAIEGEWVRSSPLRLRSAEYRYRDLNVGLDTTERFDLAICVEVAEHLQPARGPAFVDEVSRLSDCIVFAAALPRQLGDGHINCRPHTYWVEQFHRNDFVCLDAFRPAVWYDSNVEPWYAQNTLLFVQKTHPLAGTFPPAALLDVYHPLLTSRAVRRDHRNGLRDPGPI